MKKMMTSILVFSLVFCLASTAMAMRVYVGNMPVDWSITDFNDLFYDRDYGQEIKSSGFYRTSPGAPRCGWAELDITRTEFYDLIEDINGYEVYDDDGQRYTLMADDSYVCPR